MAYRIPEWAYFHNICQCRLELESLGWFLSLKTKICRGQVRTTQRRVFDQNINTGDAHEQFHCPAIRFPSRTDVCRILIPQE